MSEKRAPGIRRFTILIVDNKSTSVSDSFSQLTTFSPHIFGPWIGFSSTALKTVWSKHTAGAKNVSFSILPMVMMIWSMPLYVGNFSQMLFLIATGITNLEKSMSSIRAFEHFLQRLIDGESLSAIVSSKRRNKATPSPNEWCTRNTSYLYGNMRYFSLF